MTYSCLCTAVFRKSLVRVHRRDTGCRDNLATGHFVLPHEMNGKLYPKEKALIASFDGLEGWFGGYLGFPAMVEYVNGATIGMACVGQKGIDSAPFNPHHRKDSCLGIIVADIDLEKTRIATKLGRHGRAGFLINVAAGHKPIIFYELCCECFPYARLDPLALNIPRRRVQFCNYLLRHRSQ